MTFAQPVSLLALRRAIDAGETTVERAFDAFAERASAAEPTIGAFAASDWSAAKAAVASLADRPLRGLPVGVKDIYDTRHLPTGYGSPIYAGFRPARNAAMVNLIERAGGSLPVKTTTTEFAFLEPTTTRNPWAIERSPGGSSAGSAAAVAAGMLPAAIGTQTAGSIVRPASFCGVVGFKPSFGLLPTDGLKAFAPSLDTVGLFTAGVDDMQFFFSTLRDKEPRFDRPDAKAVRLGVLASVHDWEATGSARGALQRARARFGEAGVRLSDVAMPAPLIAADTALGAIQAYESLRALGEERRAHRPVLSRRLATYLDDAEGVEFNGYRQALDQAAEARGMLSSLFQEVDALMTFASADVAPIDRSSTGSPIFNRLWTLLGLPCVSVPGLTDGGLPIGVQLVGPPNGDEKLLAVAAVLADLLA